MLLHCPSSCKTHNTFKIICHPIYYVGYFSCKTLVVKISVFHKLYRAILYLSILFILQLQWLINIIHTHMIICHHHTLCHKLAQCFPNSSPSLPLTPNEKMLYMCAGVVLCWCALHQQILYVLSGLVHIIAMDNISPFQISLFP